MRTVRVNYNKIDGRPNKRRLIDYAITLRQVPRLALRCRLTGHRPVVDGARSVTATGPVDGARRWVVCDRCGTRPYPQGDLDPRFWQIGDQYTGPWDADGEAVETVAPAPDWAQIPARTRVPGVWPRLTGAFGVHLRLGDGHGVGLEFKLGSAGSAHLLGLALRFGFLGFLYLHTERFGQWWQRRLNPTGHQSKVIGLELADGALRWTWFVDRDIPSADEPRWRRGHLQLHPTRRRRPTTLSGHVKRTVRLPEGDYIVNLHLYPVTAQESSRRPAAGRGVGRHRLTYYKADWSTSSRTGIPTTGPTRGRVTAGHIEVTSRAVDDGTWPAEAVAVITATIGLARADAGWQPVTAEARTPVS